MCVVCSVWLRHGRRATARWRPSPCTCRQVDGEQGPARRREQVRLHHLVDAQVERARRALLDQGAVDPLVQRQVPLEAPALVLLLRLRLRTRCHLRTRLRTRCHLRTHRTACCLRLLLRLLRGLPCDCLRRRRGWSGGGWGGAWGGARLLGGRGLKHVGPVHARSIGHAACGRRSIAHAACGRRGLGGRRRGLRIGGHRRPRHPLDGTAALAAAAALATAHASAVAASVATTVHAACSGASGRVRLVHHRTRRGGQPDPVRRAGDRNSLPQLGRPAGSRSRGRYDRRGGDNDGRLQHHSE